MATFSVFALGALAGLLVAWIGIALSARSCPQARPPARVVLTWTAAGLVEMVPEGDVILTLQGAGFDGLYVVGQRWKISSKDASPLVFIPGTDRFIGSTPTGKFMEGKMP